ncbi:MAG: dynamin family protein [bacterium]|nr:dynamin family protein [Candidatus Limimorpha caballi]
MKNISIKYNPYTVTSQFSIDGKSPKTDSKLNVGKSRLQEWADLLPEWLKTEFNDNKFEIEFIGTDTDFEDLKAGFENNKAGVNATFAFSRKPCVEEAEQTIDKIFKDIQNGPVEELKSDAILKAFKKAKNSQFEVNVVATMSSGKSTLINALLGEQIMPSANEATTATIVKVLDNDGKPGEDFYAVGYDANGKKVFDRKKVKLADMQAYNAEKKVSYINMDGPIPFVESTGMKLVLVDTPGPNNARNKQHEEMTYKMLADSDKSLVLVVLNAQQSGIEDEKMFLDYVCNCMKSGGKQTKDRFIFVVNKINCFDPRPQADGPGCITRTLSSIKKDLEKRGIQNPNIFPVAALPALEKRTNDAFGMSLMTYKMMLNAFAEMQFDTYYDFSHLPNSSRQYIEACKSKSVGDDLAEIQTGIFNLEEAITLYINKYARNTKIMDLVYSFNSTLDELAAVANLEEMIRQDKDAKKKLEVQIATIRKNIKDAGDAKTYSKKIDEFDVTQLVKQDVTQLVNGIRTQINGMMVGRGTKVEAAKAEAECKQLEKNVETMRTQLKAKVEDTLTRNFTKSVTEMIGYYQMYLEELDLKVDKNVMKLSPLQIVSSQLGNIQSIVKTASKTEAGSHYETKTTYLSKDENMVGSATVGAVVGAVLGTAIPVVGTWAGAAIGGFLSGLFGRKESVSKTKHLVNTNTTYVNMADVATQYLNPILSDLKKMELSIPEYVKNETDNIKVALKKSLAEIDALIDQRLESLSQVEADNKLKASEIAEKQKKLQWLTSIQMRVNDIINF